MNTSISAYYCLADFKELCQSWFQTAQCFLLQFYFLALKLITLRIGQNVVSDNPVVGKPLF